MFDSGCVTWFDLILWLYTTVDSLSTTCQRLMVIQIPVFSSVLSSNILLTRLKYYHACKNSLKMMKNHLLLLKNLKRGFKTIQKLFQSFLINQKLPIQKVVLVLPNYGLECSNIIQKTSSLTRN